jgi:hypothetical protein
MALRGPDRVELVPMDNPAATRFLIPNTGSETAPRYFRRSPLKERPGP